MNFVSPMERVSVTKPLSFNVLTTLLSNAGLFLPDSDVWDGCVSRASTSPLLLAPRL